MLKTLFLISLSGVAALAQPPALFDEDPAHPWNRLHAALWMRQDSAGTAYGQDRLDPLLWRQSRHLLEGESHRRAMVALEEFFAVDADTLVRDPFRRAILQRDLWSIFDHLVGQDEALPPLLARAIGRLALPRETITSLPDPYASSDGLPADLLSPDGPWICLGRPDGPVAPTHSMVFPRSVFLVFLALPGGHLVTLDYLARLRDGDTAAFNLPQIPSGTRALLLRRALLIDDLGQIVPSPLTVQVEMREYLAVPEVTPERLRSALFAGQTGFDAEQRFFEARLRRASGTLAPVDLDFPNAFLNHGFDFLERDQASAERRRHPVLQACAGCHRLPGVYSVNTLFFFRSRLTSDGQLFGDGTLADLSESPAVLEAQKAVEHLRRLATWTELASLLSE